LGEVVNFTLFQEIGQKGFFTFGINDIFLLYVSDAIKQG